MKGMTLKKISKGKPKALNLRRVILRGRELRQR